MPKGIIEFFSAPYKRLLARLPVVGGKREAVRRGRWREHAEQADEIKTIARSKTEIIMEVEAISKRFGGLLAVNNLSFSVNAGEILGIIGPNGAGKSTLFNVLSGVYEPDSGIFKFKGRVLSDIHKSHVICRLGVGRTFQLVKPFENITVLENVMVGAFCRHRKSAEAERLALAVLDFVGMLDKKDYPGHSLTLGDQAKLELAWTLATGPEILLLDEVMAGLTTNEIGDAITLIKKIRDHGMTVLLVEHVMQAIMSLSDRVMVLAEGTKITEGIPEDIIHDSRVIKAYLGEGYEPAEA